MVKPDNPDRSKYQEYGVEWSGAYPWQLITSGQAFDWTACSYPHWAYPRQPRIRSGDSGRVPVTNPFLPSRNRPAPPCSCRASRSEIATLKTTMWLHPPRILRHLQFSSSIYCSGAFLRIRERRLWVRQLMSCHGRRWHYCNSRDIDFSFYITENEHGLGICGGFWALWTEGVELEYCTAEQIPSF